MHPMYHPKSDTGRLHIGRLHIGRLYIPRKVGRGIIQLQLLLKIVFLFTCSKQRQHVIKIYINIRTGNAIKQNRTRRKCNPNCKSKTNRPLKGGGRNGRTKPCMANTPIRTSFLHVVQALTHQ